MPTVITTEAKPEGPELEIRMPMGARLLQLCVFLVGTFVAAVVTIALAGRGTPWAALAGLALAVWIGYFYRLLHIAVIVRGENIEVRNLFSTHRVERSQIDDVGLGESAVTRAPNRTVVLCLLDGRRLSIDACARQLQSGRRLRKVEDFRARLAVWSGHRQSDRGGDRHLQQATRWTSSGSEES
ncbi:MAG: PH domain-containing protein [Acidimicrobiales bacterium]